MKDKELIILQFERIQYLQRENNSLMYALERLKR